MHPLAEVRGDVDQRIGREARKAAAQQFIDAGLRTAAMLGRFKLRLVVFLNQRSDLVCQLSGQTQIHGLLRGVCAGVTVDLLFGHLLHTTMEAIR